MTSTSYGSAAYLEQLRTILGTLNTAEVDRIIEIITNAAAEGRQVFICGNGGSASTASHAITDWNKMTYIHTGQPFRGVCLNDNVGLITAFANDVDYAEVFVGQLRSLVRAGDVVIAISGSGNSPNVVRAIEHANGAGAITIGFCGFDGGKLKAAAQHSVWVRSRDMQICEDVHLSLCHMVMKALCRVPVS